jgi:hypothetical protein
MIPEEVVGRFSPTACSHKMLSNVPGGARTYNLRLRRHQTYAQFLANAGLTISTNYKGSCGFEGFGTDLVHNVEVIRGLWEQDEINFAMNRLGHVVVSGQLFDYSELSQSLKFAFRTDQTVLGLFLRGLALIRGHNQPLLWTAQRRVCMLSYLSARLVCSVAGQRMSSVILPWQSLTDIDHRMAFWSCLSTIRRAIGQSALQAFPAIHMVTSSPNWKGAPLRAPLRHT